ncbi:antitoxin Xre-like helix-turn-helix domain-containing protein [Roseovarius sp. CAU 1744]|uniref:MbcA/ParS/Xre antitoxin family protein n=1 Tax=Roseovarius sp. CAU 1744 TaxID=3140368 RepID=UPI00325A9A7C
MSAPAERIDDVSPEPGRVVAKAVFNAAQELGLSQRELAQAIGVSEATVSRMKGGGYVLQGKPFELATCLIRVFRSLDAIAGADPDTMRGWIGNENHVLNGIPRQMMMQATGLIAVMNYLDAARAPT